MLSELPHLENQRQHLFERKDTIHHAFKIETELDESPTRKSRITEIAFNINVRMVSAKTNPGIEDEMIESIFQWFD